MFVKEIKGHSINVTVYLKVTQITGNTSQNLDLLLKKLIKTRNLGGSRGCTSSNENTDDA